MKIGLSQFGCHGTTFRVVKDRIIQREHDQSSGMHQAAVMLHVSSFRKTRKVCQHPSTKSLKNGTHMGLVDSPYVKVRPWEGLS